MTASTKERNIYSILFFNALTIIFCISCSQDSEHPQIDFSQLPQCELKLVDSLFMDNTSGHSMISVSKNGRSIAYDWSMNTIIVSDKSGQILHKFSIEVGVGNNFRGADFFKDESQIIVIGLLRYAIYSLEGKLLASGRMGNGSTINSPFQDFGQPVYFNPEGDTILICRGGEFSGSSLVRENYSKYENIVLYNLSKNTYKVGVGYPKESVYQKGNICFDEHNPIASRPDKEGNIKLVFPQERYIYTYNQDLELKEKQPLFPQHFKKPKGIAFNASNLNSLELMKSSFGGSQYASFINLPDGRFLLGYEGGISSAERLDELWSEIDFSTGSASLVSLYQEMDIWLEFYDANGQKISQDIKIPEGYLLPHSVVGNNRILLNLAHQDETSPLRVYHIYELVLSDTQ